MTRSFSLGPLLGAAVVVGLATPAVAASVGLAISPANGNDRSVITVSTQGPCEHGTNIIGRLFGTGFPKDGQVVVGNSATTAYPKTTAGGYVVPLAMTMRDFQNLQDEPTPLSGTYRIEIACRDNVKPAVLQAFNGTLTITAPRTFSTSDPGFTPTPAPQDPNALLPGGDGSGGIAGASAAPAAGAPTTGASVAPGEVNAEGVDATAQSVAARKDASTTPILVVIGLVLALLIGAIVYRNTSTREANRP